MKYALPALPRLPALLVVAQRRSRLIGALGLSGNLFQGRLLLPVLALGGLLLFTGCADPPYMAHFKRAHEYMEAKNYPAAECEYREAIRLKPDYAEAHYDLGLMLGMQRKYEEEVAEFREVIRLKADDDYAHFDLGMAFWMQGKYEEAIAEFREAIRLKPNDAVRLQIIANLFDLYGRRAEAREYWERSLKSETRPEWVNKIKKRLAEPD